MMRGIRYALFASVAAFMAAIPLQIDSDSRTIHGATAFAAGPGGGAAGGAGGAGAGQDAAAAGREMGGMASGNETAEVATSYDPYSGTTGREFAGEVVGTTRAAEESNALDAISGVNVALDEDTDDVEDDGDETTE